MRLVLQILFFLNPTRTAQVNSVGESEMNELFQKGASTRNSTKHVLHDDYTVIQKKVSQNFCYIFCETYPIPIKFGKYSTSPK